MSRYALRKRLVVLDDDLPCLCRWRELSPAVALTDSRCLRAATYRQERRKARGYPYCVPVHRRGSFRARLQRIS